MSGALVSPGGNPELLEQLAARLDLAARGTGNLADSTSHVTAGIRSSAQWDGQAADAYTAFTGSLSRGIGAAQPPLSRIAAAVREYAGYLRAAQQKVAVYQSAAADTRASGSSAASVAAADAAGQDAAVAVAAQQAAGDRAAAQVRGAGGDLADVFGPTGPVRSWIERLHAPWDSLAGDAVLARFLSVAEDGREGGELAEKFAAAIPKMMADDFQATIRPLMADLSSGEATEGDLASAMRTMAGDWDAITRWNGAWQEGSEAEAAGFGELRGVGYASGALGVTGDVFTEIHPEDSGAMGWVDRGTAGVNGVLLTADMLTAELPVAGEVVLVGTGLYLGADYLYHHWTPFRDVANDVGHAAVSGAKDAWHDVTSIF